ncbi:MAG: hypothetical protein ACSHX0_00895 [Akkermansiaceae bacterium]
MNHDGQGNLSGLAWSANTGWINFGWATTTNAFRPRVDLSTGVLSNTGNAAHPWANFSLNN